MGGRGRQHFAHSWVGNPPGDWGGLSNPSTPHQGLHARVLPACGHYLILVSELHAKERDTHFALSLFVVGTGGEGGVTGC